MAGVIAGGHVMRNKVPVNGVVKVDYVAGEVLNGLKMDAMGILGDLDDMNV